MPDLTAPEWIHWQDRWQKANGTQWTVGLKNDQGYHGSGNSPDEYMCVGGVCTEAEARLMSAAPQMLAALRDVVAVMECDLAGLALIQPELAVARTAIVRATESTP